jgi:CheY-like chemotaxis protein
VPQTLLLADDSVTIQRVIELTFADQDIDVVAVSDGDQAIARLDTMPPDIVLVDVGMPGRSGYDVAGHVKHTPHLSHIPVVLLTGAFEPVDEVKASALGCEGILAKPFEPQMVISRVKELLARPAADSAAPAPPDALDAFAPETRSDVPAGNAEAVAKLDEYFDQLHSAFARFTSTETAKPADLIPPVVEDTTPADLDWFGPPRGAEISEFDPSLSLEPAPSGLQVPDSAELVREIQALAPPAIAELVEPAPQPAAVSEPVAVPEPVAAQEPVALLKPVASPEAIPALEPVGTPPAAYTMAASIPQASEPRNLPSLPDAFAAILAAEQATVGTPSAWPSPQAAAAAPAITDDLIDRVSRRVIEQLTDRVVREAVADAVAGVAERLVREEIERIKASIKD